MSVEVNIRPELRGEIDASKLSRLLRLIPTITSTINKSNWLSSVIAADIAVFGAHTHTSLKPFADIQVDTKPLLFPDLVSSLMKNQIKIQKNVGDTEEVERGEEIDLYGDIRADEVKDTDVTRVRMSISVKIPEVALDLTYDVLKGRHLVLTMHTLDMQILFRLMDMQVLQKNVICIHGVSYCISLFDY